MENYFDEEFYQWDDNAHAAYLSIQGEIPLESKFVSYDDEKSIRSKIEFIRQRGVGGAIIWELSGAHFREAAKGEKDPLLQAVKREVWGGEP
jgi:GH18 family chitinase